VSKKKTKLTELQQAAFEQLKKGDVYCHDGQNKGFCLEGHFETPKKDVSGPIIASKRRAFYGLVDKGIAKQEDIWSGLQLSRQNYVTGSMQFNNYRTQRFTLKEKPA